MSEVVTTQKILIVDANGKPRMCLDAEYGIRLLGEDGRPKASLGLLKEKTQNMTLARWGEIYLSTYARKKSQ